MLITFLMIFSWVWVVLFAVATISTIHTYMKLTPTQRVFVSYEPNTIGSVTFLAAVVFLVTYYIQ